MEATTTGYLRCHAVLTSGTFKMAHIKKINFTFGFNVLRQLKCNIWSKTGIVSKTSNRCFLPFNLVNKTE
jgi:hypothetical protein